MDINEDFRDRVIDPLIPFGDISSRHMFGCCGIFESGVMFALIAKSKLYLKVDSWNRAIYTAMGSSKFGKLAYFEVPNAAMNNPATLHRLIEESLIVCREAKRPKR